ncbi:MAG: hypothetical protein PHV74_12500, partial [Dehalococcoidia bacterium]|nr:hypothetical protein [Dehalococcoidia bacterium]
MPTNIDYNYWKTLPEGQQKQISQQAQAAGGLVFQNMPPTHIDYPSFHQLSAEEQATQLAKASGPVTWEGMAPVNLRGEVPDLSKYKDAGQALAAGVKPSDLVAAGYDVTKKRTNKDSSFVEQFSKLSRDDKLMLKSSGVEALNIVKEKQAADLQKWQAQAEAKLGQYKNPDGSYNIVQALRHGVKAKDLEAAGFSKDQIKENQQAIADQAKYTSALANIEKARIKEEKNGQTTFDLVAAIRAGVSADDIRTVFGQEALTNAKKQERALSEIEHEGGFLQAIKNGVHVSTFIDAGYDVAAYKDAQEAIDQGVEREQKLEPYKLIGPVLGDRPRPVDYNRMAADLLNKGQSKSQVKKELVSLGCSDDEAEYAAASPEERFHILQNRVGEDGEPIIPKKATYAGEEDGQPLYNLPASEDTRTIKERFLSESPEAQQKLISRALEHTDSPILQNMTFDELDPHFQEVVLSKYEMGPEGKLWTAFKADPWGTTKTLITEASPVGTWHTIQDRGFFDPVSLLSVGTEALIVFPMVKGVSATVKAGTSIPRAILNETIVTARGAVTTPYNVLRHPVQTIKAVGTPYESALYPGRVPLATAWRGSYSPADIAKVSAGLSDEALATRQAMETVTEMLISGEKSAGAVPIEGFGRLRFSGTGLQQTLPGTSITSTPYTPAFKGKGVVAEGE